MAKMKEKIKENSSKSKRKNKESGERESIKRKISEVETITEKCKESKTLVISNIETITTKKFQELRKKLRKDVLIKVVKKSMIERIIKKLGISVEEVEDYISKPFAILLTNLDVFELATLLEQHKEPAFLKPNQIVEKDIIIEPGPTDLPPTAMADLTKAGLKVAIEKGKIMIKEQKIIKKGEKISPSLADALQKLDIRPIKIGLNVNVGIDIKSKKIYKNIIINKEEEIEKLRIAASRALNLALNIGYACKQTIAALIQKAFIHATNLNKFTKPET